MSALIRQLALVSQSARISAADLMKVSAALQKQVTRDLAPIWEISATIDTFDKLADVPSGYWPLVLMDDIDTPGAAGIHKDDNNQPMALISASDSLDEWSLTASHEALEMLVDPSGDRLVAGDSPMPDQGRVSFLVEVCDPSEASNNGYSVNGILVSDFYTPHFFDPVQASGVRYSFTGAIQGPRQVLNGGYLSWLEPTTRSWWQETFFEGSDSTFHELGSLAQKPGGSLRQAVDAFVMSETKIAIGRGRVVADAAGLKLERNATASKSYANGWQRQIAGLLNGHADGAAKAGRRDRRPTPMVRPEPPPDPSGRH